MNCCLILLLICFISVCSLSIHICPLLCLRCPSLLGQNVVFYGDRVYLYIILQYECTINVYAATNVTLEKYHSYFGASLAMCK